MREFLALPLPEPLRSDAATLSGVLGLSSAGWRLVRAEGLHVTIRFLGEVDPAHHDRLNAAWREAAGGTHPLTLRIGGASVAPNPERPRVVWLTVHDETGDGALAQLASRLERAATLQGFAPESRRFAAHVTLARARRGVRARAANLDSISGLGSFTADRLVLYRSRLGPGGSVYEELSSYPLGNGGPS